MPSFSCVHIIRKVKAFHAKLKESKDHKKPKLKKRKPKLENAEETKKRKKGLLLERGEMRSKLKQIIDFNKRRDDCFGF